ncbi:MAG: hypothetical protein ACYDH5_10965 [Acidimicrobiales bacterium]
MIVGLTGMSAVRTVVVPRGVPSVLAGAVFVAVRLAFRVAAGRSPSYERRDRIEALYAPAALLALPVVWLALVLAGYMLVYWGAGTGSMHHAFALSGSALFTLGTTSPPGELLQGLGFVEAGTGIGLLALLISYLPLLYATFAKREAAVTLLEARAGTPYPSGEEMLWRYHTIGLEGGLTQVWMDWEAWFADLEESHTSNSALAFFRSPVPERSWVTAAGAVLDGASLACSLLPEHSPEAELCIRAGYIALRRVAGFFGIGFDPDPAPGDPVSVTRAEFDATCDRLAAAGLSLGADRERAWLDFAGWRVNYDAALIGLCGLVAAPPAPWSGDRAGPWRRPKVLRGLRRQRV